MKFTNIILKKFRNFFYKNLKRGIELRKGKCCWNKGLTKETSEGVRKISESHIGKTKENNEGIRRMVEKRSGRTKETDEGVRKQSEKMRERTKGTHEGGRKMAETLEGRSMKNYEYLRKKSEDMKSRRGKNAIAWQGGISFDPYCEKFDDDLKERVREYFGRCCYVCGIGESEIGRKLDVHHVSYNKDTCCDNTKPLFVPLCPRCHAKTNKDRDDWEEFFTVSLEYLTQGECFLPKINNIGGENI